MSKRKSAAAAAVEFFQTAEIGVAREILAICVNTVKQRDGGGTKRAAAKKSTPAGVAQPVEAPR